MQRKKIIWGFGIFLFLMLVLYLVSRGIYAESLPQVDVVSPEVMSLNHSVSAIGSVACGSEIAVFVPENLPVKQVWVRVGDQVESGDVLFSCDVGILTQMAAEEDLEISKLKKQIQALSQNAQLEKEAKDRQKNRALEDYEALLEESKKNYKAVEGALKNAARVLEDAMAELPVDSTLGILRLDLESRKKQWEAYNLLIENNGQVIAKQGGLLTEVAIQAGGWTSNQAAFLLADTEEPFVFEAHLSGEQRQYVNRHMQVSVFLEDSFQPYKGKIDYLTDGPVGDGSVDVAVRLEEGVGNPGESGTLKTSMQTETFACCVPLEALHKDGNQRDYVYILVETEGVLGTELSVRKQYVQVLDKSDKYAALEPGIFGGDEKVITYATKEMAEGDVVRMR